MSAAEETYRLQVHDLEIDWFRRTVRRSGRDVHLTPREFELLQYLVTHRGRVLSRSTLRTHLYGTLRFTSNVIDVYIRYLREKLDRAGSPPLIVTCRGSGYLFREECAPAGSGGRPG